MINFVSVKGYIPVSLTTCIISTKYAFEFCQE